MPEMGFIYAHKFVAWELFRLAFRRSHPIIYCPYFYIEIY